jgi:hypothetical protein
MSRVDFNPEHYKLGNVYAFVAMRREINGAATNFLALLTRPDAHMRTSSSFFRPGLHGIT